MVVVVEIVNVIDGLVLVFLDYQYFIFLVLGVLFQIDVQWNIVCIVVWDGGGVGDYGVVCWGVVVGEWISLQ